MSGPTTDGRCLCGAVQVTLENPKQHVEVCHCDMCRRWTGAWYPALEGESFSLAGEDAIRVHRSSDWAERAFCGTCGSHLWYKFLPTGNRSFLAGLFADANDLPVEREIFVEERAAWSTLPGEHPKLTGEEVIAEAKAQGLSFD
ncbi:GFA family protein [Aurantiacibacter aquimixticola]|uniref:GFA family protein n=1 Tax=Aurantiacibacter aquimixticola TaxID=1958945 RepID=A0A419RR96_9SPHN|nr:GFA family protein [Aurantiacibacter aquimixticola]RJY08297.1 GFA family protein [Aurantiacibacter aquimixticola]